jgi:hypothetical protein
MRLIAVVLVLAAMILLAGCDGFDQAYLSGNSPNDATEDSPHYSPFSNSAAPPPPPVSSNSDGPRVITDLSQISSAPAPGPMNPGEQQAFIKTETAKAPLAEVTQYNLDRFYLASQPFEFDQLGAKPHGDITILNKKAARFPEFSYPMLNRTLPLAEKLGQAALDQRELPNDLKPVILTVTLSPIGHPVDIAIEQHSGVAAIDHAMIDACKQGLWAMNPPPAAAQPDQTYKLRFEGVIYEYSYNRYGQYTYITHIGLGVL